MDIKEIRKFEDAFSDGVYAVPSNTKIKVRTLVNFCKENNVTPAQLSEEQMEEFIEKREQ